MKHARADYDRIQDPAGIIPADEPVFLLRGQDVFAAKTLDFYADYLEAHGGSKEIIALTRAQAAKMRAWWVHKSPDIPAIPPHEQQEASK